ncbi:hypothetical protein L7F22_050114 [Adiantum nelumboides]|nr:hypothetical protein [Adiantum nelumboides]
MTSVLLDKPKAEEQRQQFPENFMESNVGERPVSLNGLNEDNGKTQCPNGTAPIGQPEQQVDQEIEEWNIGSESDPKMIKINKLLKKELKDKAWNLKFKDVFAWEHSDLKRVDPEMISATNIDVSVMRKVKSAMLKGFSETGRNEEALTIYNEIRDEGGYPHSTAFSTLLWSLGNAGQLEPLLALFMPFRKSIKGRSRIFQEMQTSVACSHIVHALISHNHLGYISLSLINLIAWQCLRVAW